MPGKGQDRTRPSANRAILSKSEHEATIYLLTISHKTNNFLFLVLKTYLLHYPYFISRSWCWSTHFSSLVTNRSKLSNDQLNVKERSKRNVASSFAMSTIVLPIFEYFYFLSFLFH